MKCCVLASGSKGNCTYIEYNNTKILIDLGTTSLYAEKKLKDIDVDPKDIKAIIITHTHVDHINGLKVFIKKYNPKIYLSEIMHKELKNDITLTNYEYIDGDFTIDDLKINVIKTSHDTEDSNGYIVESSDSSIVYITDTGYINQKNFKKLINKNVYIFESNHDVEMLMNGRYPYNIKQRILGDKGHLSNKDAGYYLSKLIGDNTKQVILAHLSHDNNTDDIALKTVKEELKTSEIEFDNIIIAHQEFRTDLIEV